MFLHRNDQKMTTFNYFGPRILFVRPERTVGNNGLKGKKVWCEIFKLLQGENKFSNCRII